MLPAGGRIAVIVPVAALLPSPAVRILVAHLAQGTQNRVDPFPSGDRFSAQKSADRLPADGKGVGHGPSDRCDAGECGTASLGVVEEQLCHERSPSSGRQLVRAGHPHHLRHPPTLAGPGLLRPVKTHIGQA